MAARISGGALCEYQAFDDLLNLLVKQQFTACGILGNCQVQYVIEADGSVYPCDFYVLDDYRMGIFKNRPCVSYLNRTLQNVCVSTARNAKEMSELPVSKMCRGGCKRMKDAIYVDGDYCGYQQLLQEFVPQINRILGLLQG